MINKNIKTVKELRKFLEEWADFVELDDNEFKDALLNECGLDLLVISEDS